MEHLKYIKSIIDHVANGGVVVSSPERKQGKTIIDFYLLAHHLGYSLNLMFETNKWMLAHKDKNKNVEFETTEQAKKFLINEFNKRANND